MIVFWNYNDRLSPILLIVETNFTLVTDSRWCGDRNCSSNSSASG